MKREMTLSASEARADAAYIVRAVNAHESLVAALRDLLAATALNRDSLAYSVEYVLGEPHPAVIAARAALALAEKGE